MIAQEDIEKNYVDSPKAAQMLKISDARIRRLCLDGRFKGAVKAGKSWLIPKIAVENFERLKHWTKPSPKKSSKDILANAIAEANKWKESEKQKP